MNQKEIREPNSTVLLRRALVHLEDPRENTSEIRDQLARDLRKELNKQKRMSQ